MSVVAVAIAMGSILLAKIRSASRKARFALTSRRTNERFFANPLIDNGFLLSANGAPLAIGKGAVVEFREAPKREPQIFAESGRVS